MSKASILALSLALACASSFAGIGCGREDYLPATPDEFEPRTPPDNIAVIEADHEDRKTYKHIGTVMVKARKSNNAIKGCRTVAAEHGGDAVEIRPQGDRELKCLVLRRKDVRIED